jgi:hypothetical protein
MTGRNPDGAEDFPPEVAHGPQRLNTIIGAYEDFRDLCVPRIPSTALTSEVALRPCGGDDHRSCACGWCSS